MFHFKTLTEWHKFATSGSNPVIVEKDDKQWVVHHRDGYEIQDKPANWKEVMAVVNCPHRAPISAELGDAIRRLFDVDLKIDIWNPWPTLAHLKNNGALLMSIDRDDLILKNTLNDKTVSIDVLGAGAIVAKWERLGFEHDDLLCFAAALTPFNLNKMDPWLGLMQWKERFGVELSQVKDGDVIVDGLGIPIRRGVSFPDGFKTKELVQLFNDGDVPPGCVTAWDPFYTVDEALPLLQKAYGTPEFDKLVARFRGGKLPRSP